MQVEYKDGSRGDPVTANTVEDLVPMIKKALKDPDVRCVRVFAAGSRVTIESDRKSQADYFKDEFEADVKANVSGAFPNVEVTSNVKRAAQYISKSAVKFKRARMAFPKKR